MNSTAKLFLEKLINKAFPEFSNKVTWTLIMIGIALLAVPVPTYVLLLNLLIDFYNNTMKSNVRLIDIGNFAPSTGTALTLILSGLIYHLAIKSIQILGEIHKARIKQEINNKITETQKENNERIANADRMLFQSFMSILPSNSISIEFLKEQDFGSPFHNNYLKDIENLTFQWGKADQHFHDSELEKKASDFYEETKMFLYFLATSSGFIGTSSLLSIPTDNERANDWSWSENTNRNVSKANEWSQALYEAYCDLVASSRSKLFI